MCLHTVACGHACTRALDWPLFDKGRLEPTVDQHHPRTALHRCLPALRAAEVASAKAAGRDGGQLTAAAALECVQRLQSTAAA